MNAIDLLKLQHREVEDLFGELDEAGEGARWTKERLCREISDRLAVHAEIEERIFYPESKQEDVEALLRESVDEHLAMKRLLAQIMESGAEGEQFLARMKVLQQQIGHHVEQEENELFPRVRQSCTEDEHDRLGARMERLAEELLEEGEPPSYEPHHPSPA